MLIEAYREKLDVVCFFASDSGCVYVFRESDSCIRRGSLRNIRFLLQWWFPKSVGAEPVTFPTLMLFSTKAHESMGTDIIHCWWSAWIIVTSARSYAFIGRQSQNTGSNFVKRQYVSGHERIRGFSHWKTAEDRDTIDEAQWKTNVVSISGLVAWVADPSSQKPAKKLLQFLQTRLLTDSKICAGVANMRVCRETSKGTSTMQYRVSHWDLLVWHPE